MAKFLRVIVNTIMIVAIVVAASLLIPPFVGVTTLIVDDIEMETNLEVGSVTYAWGVDAGELKVGDKVLLQEETDMVYSISSVEGSEFVLEDTLSTDGEMISKELQGVIDKVVLTIPVLGYVSMALHTVEGLIIVGLSVVFVIILFILAEIWRKEEEDDWEEESDEEEFEEESGEEESGESDKKETEEIGADKKEIQQTENQSPETDQKETEPENADKAESETGNMSTGEEVNKGALDDVTVSDEFAQAEKEVRKTSNTVVCKESKEKVLAMPLYTKEEWLERAKAAGDEPELVMDEISGVTFLDYSDVL